MKSTCLLEVVGKASLIRLLFFSQFLGTVVNLDNDCILPFSPLQYVTVVIRPATIVKVSNINFLRLLN